MDVNGKCHCGKIRYRAKVDPAKISVCHCTDCQVMSGGAFRVSAHIAVADFELLSGTIKSYVKTAESGNKRVQAFCPDCGTHLYAENLENPTLRSLRVGTVDERHEIRPTRQIWCRSALPWAQELKAVEPRYERDGKW